MGRKSVVGRTGGWALEQQVGDVAIDGVGLRFDKHSVVMREEKRVREEGGEVAYDVGGKGERRGSFTHWIIDALSAPLPPLPSYSLRCWPDGTKHLGCTTASSCQAAPWQTEQARPHSTQLLCIKLG